MVASTLVCSACGPAVIDGAGPGSRTKADTDQGRCDDDASYPSWRDAYDAFVARRDVPLSAAQREIVEGMRDERVLDPSDLEASLPVRREAAAALLARWSRIDRCAPLAPHLIGRHTIERWGDGDQSDVHTRPAAYRLVDAILQKDDLDQHPYRLPHERGVDAFVCSDFAEALSARHGLGQSSAPPSERLPLVQVQLWPEVSPGERRPVAHAFGHQMNAMFLGPSSATLLDGPERDWLWIEPQSDEVTGSPFDALSRMSTGIGAAYLIALRAGDEILGGWLREGGMIGGFRALDARRTELLQGIWLHRRDPELGGQLDLSGYACGDIEHVTRAAIATGYIPEEIAAQELSAARLPAGCTIGDIPLAPPCGPSTCDGCCEGTVCRQPGGDMCAAPDDGRCVTCPETAPFAVVVTAATITASCDSPLVADPCDPYVEVTLDSELGSRGGRTRTIKNSAEPRWDEAVFTASKEELLAGELRVKIFDQELLRDTLIEEITFHATRAMLGSGDFKVVFGETSISLRLEPNP